MNVEIVLLQSSIYSSFFTYVKLLPQVIVDTIDILIKLSDRRLLKYALSSSKLKLIVSYSILTFTPINLNSLNGFHKTSQIFIFFIFELYFRYEFFLKHGLVYLLHTVHWFCLCYIEVFGKYNINMRTVDFWL